MQQSFKKDQYIHDKALKKYPKDKEKQNKHIQENRKETLEVFNEYLLWLKSIKEKVDMKPKFTTAVNYILNDEEALRKYLPYTKLLYNKDFKRVKK